MSAESKEISELLRQLRGEKKKPSLAELFNKLMIGLVGGIIASIFHAFVTTKLWGWFIVTAFDAPQISMVTAYGFALMFAAIRGYRKSEVDLDKEDFAVLLLTPFGVSGLLLFMGWIVHTIAN